MLRNTFLYRLFKADKVLFAFIAVYIIGVAYYSLRQREEFPFFLYGMYSLKEAPQKTYTTYSIEIDSQQVRYSKLRDTQRELISNTLSRVVPMMEDGSIGTMDTLYKSWLMAYTADMRMVGDNKMHVFKLTCNYVGHGQVNILKKEQIYVYGEE